MFLFSGFQGETFFDKFENFIELATKNNNLEYCDVFKLKLNDSSIYLLDEDKKQRLLQQMISLISFPLILNQSFIQKA